MSLLPRTTSGGGSLPSLLLLGGLAAGLLAGCGSNDSPPGAGRPPAAVPPSSAPASPATQATPAAQDTYGGYPTFLPSDTVGGGFAHRVVDASARRPALATQGDTVRVHVGRATVLATLTGPDVPVSGQQYQAPASPATWHVVLRAASAAVPLDPATFQAVDERGAVYDLQPRGQVPTVLEPGHVARFDLFSPAFQVGEGRLRWIPVGHLAPVEWDFVVETD